MADGLRSQDAVKDTEEAQILGGKATGGLDADEDHIGNVEGGLKAYVCGPVSWLTLVDLVQSNQ